jgi:hypothetical protein
MPGCAPATSLAEPGAMASATKYTRPGQKPARPGGVPIIRDLFAGSGEYNAQMTLTHATVEIPAVSAVADRRVAASSTWESPT